MREAFGRMLVVVACIGMAVFLFRMESAEALPPGSRLHTQKAVNCPPLNLPAKKLECGNGYQALKVEVEGSTAVYFCGANAMNGGILASEAAANCDTRCIGASCPIGGGAWQPDVVGPGQATCWSQNAGNDAGVLVKVSCIR